MGERINVKCTLMYASEDLAVKEYDCLMWVL